MARRTCSHKSLTPTATGDTADLIDSSYPFALQGGTATQRTKVSEVKMGGQATSSAPTFMVLGRDSQVATGSLTADTNLLDAPIDPATAALAAPVVVFNKAATNKPRRSSTLGCLLNMPFNAYGGFARWVAPPDGEIIMLGNTASFGELSFSAFTGGTAGSLGADLTYETL